MSSDDMKRALARPEMEKIADAMREDLAHPVMEEIANSIQSIGVVHHFIFKHCPLNWTRDDDEWVATMICGARGPDFTHRQWILATLRKIGFERDADMLEEKQS